MDTSTSTKINIFKLTNNDIIIGNILSSDEESITLEHPYSIYDLGDGPCVVPYELPTLLSPMETITLRMFDIMWNKKLSDFSTVQDQYFAATTGIDIENKEIIL